MPNLQFPTRGPLGMAIALIVLCGAPGPVHAGPIEEFAQLALHPTDPNIMALRYTAGGDGLFITHDAGQSWQLVCSAMLAFRGDLKSMRIAGDGSIFVARGFEGLWQGTDRGCGWRKTDAITQLLADVASDPDDPAVMWAVTSSGDDGAQNAVWRRDASGAWAALGTADGTLLSRVRTTRLSDGGLRIYESGQRGTRAVAGSSTGLPNYMIRVSDDAGLTWSEYPFEAPAGTSQTDVSRCPFRLEAIDPRTPDRIVASVDCTVTADALLVSDDRGASFRPYLTGVTDLGGLALTLDGRVFIGDKGDRSNPGARKGLWAAPDLGTAPTLVSSEYGVYCLAHQPDTDLVFACQQSHLGTVDPESGAFTTVFDFWQATELVSCPGVDAAQVCKAQLCGDYCGPAHYASAQLCQVYSDPNCGPAAAAMDAALGATPRPAAGTRAPVAGAPAATSQAMQPVLPPAAPPPSAGCAIGARNPSDTTAAALLPLAALLFLRKRRRRTRLPQIRAAARSES